MSPARARRAFTLVEVIVSLTLSIGVLGVCTVITVNTLAEGRRARVLGEMARDGALATQLLTQELKQAGLGVPSGAHIDSGYGSSSGVTFTTSLLVAATSQVGIVGDLARADATYNAYGPLHNRTLGTNHVAWHTENNGGCVPDHVTGSCATSTTSLFFPGEAGCNTTTSFGDRTCPWGLRRVLAGERLIIVSGDGRWTHAGFDATGAVEQAGTAQVFAAKLAAAWSPADWPDPPVPSLPVTMPNETAGQGWVATLDRVFFTFDAATNTLQRIHCTGDPDPANANWPPPTATAIPASLTYTPTGGTATSCGPFEVVARHVDSVTFSYFDAGDSAVATSTLTTGAAKKGVRRIAWRIQFRQPIDGRDVVYDVAGTARLQNL